MSTLPKLTKPQRLLLINLSLSSPRYLAESYPPRKALAKLGLIETQWENRWRPTEAGRALAAQIKEVKP